MEQTIMIDGFRCRYKKCKKVARVLNLYSRYDMIL